MKTAVFVACLVPLALLCVDIWHEVQEPGSALGAEPAEAVVHWLGNWAVRLLLITLGLSSLARLTPLKKALLVRRMLGLFAFCYVLLHLAAYLFLLAEGELEIIIGDFVKRPYITVGLAAFGLLIPLAITSTRGWQRRLKRNWLRLHRLVYPAATLVIVHLVWMAKSSYFDSVLYGSILLILFLERAYLQRSKFKRRIAAAPI